MAYLLQHGQGTEVTEASVAPVVTPIPTVFPASLDGLIAWLEQQDLTETYLWYDACNCLIGQFTRQSDYSMMGGVPSFLNFKDYHFVGAGGHYDQQNKLISAKCGISVRPYRGQRRSGTAEQQSGGERWQVTRQRK
jgi:hypothetical protein